MTTTIVPAIGNSPLMTQAGTGASPGYQAVDVRRMASNFDLGEGVSTYGSFRVSQRGAGANMSVDVNMDDAAYIRGDAVALQGLYPVPPHSATINETVTTADATNPRIDRVILELKDTTHDASGSNLVQTRVMAGTPTGGATLDNLTGAAAVPNSALLLADVLVPAASSSVTNANIRDRRPFQTGTIPIPKTAVDMVSFASPFISNINGGSAAPCIIGGSGQGAHQSCALMSLPRRIVGATRIRWHYRQDSIAATGSYVIGIYDASGRKIIDTGAVSFTGAASTYQQRSETITATTFEPGSYYVLYGYTHVAGNAYAIGVDAGNGDLAGGWAYLPNSILFSATGGTTAPTTILGLSDLVADTSSSSRLAVPMIALSVG